MHCYNIEATRETVSSLVILKVEKHVKPCHERIRVIYHLILYTVKPPTDLIMFFTSLDNTSHTAAQLTGKMLRIRVWKLVHQKFFFCFFHMGLRTRSSTALNRVTS